jgi:hypothetical protein
MHTLNSRLSYLICDIRIEEEQLLSKHRRRARMGRASVVAVAATIAIAVTPATANANLTWFFQGYLGPGAQDADVTRTQLTSTWAFSDGPSRKASAGAHYPGGWTLYGSYWTAWLESCQPYPNQNLGSMVQNPHTVAQTDFTGWSGWVYNGIGSGC